MATRNIKIAYENIFLMSPTNAFIKHLFISQLPATAQNSGSTRQNHGINHLHDNGTIFYPYVGRNKIGQDHQTLSADGLGW